MIYLIIGAGALLLGYALWTCIMHEYRDAQDIMTLEDLEETDGNN